MFCPGKRGNFPAAGCLRACDQQSRGRKGDRGVRFAARDLLDSTVGTLGWCMNVGNLLKDVQGKRLVFMNDLEVINMDDFVCSPTFSHLEVVGCPKLAHEGCASHCKTTSEVGFVSQVGRDLNSVGGSLGAPISGSLRAPESGSLGTPKSGIRDT